MRTPSISALTAAALAGAVATADADQRAIGVGGTASANGVVDIIIEDNDSPNRDVRASRAVRMVSVQISGGSTAPQSARTVRDRLEEDLPPPYSIFIPNSDETVVVIDRPDEIVSLKIVDNVPDQTFQEVPPPEPRGRSAPVAAPITLALSAAGMAWVAARSIRRRRTRASAA